MKISHFENQALNRYHIVFQMPKIFVCLAGLPKESIHPSWLE